MEVPDPCGGPIPAALAWSSARECVVAGCAAWPATARARFPERQGRLVELFEWGISGRGFRPLPRTVGISGSLRRAYDQMMDGMHAVPAGERAHGWVTALALAADRLTYDRLDTLARVARDADGSLRWMSGDDEARTVPDGGVADLLRMPSRTAVVDGQLVRRLRLARGLSQEDLAWKAGLGLTTLARVEHEDRPACKGRTLACLAEVLGENPLALVLADEPG
jgi:DNA-binding XRE family transcriptional regulator